MCDQSAVYSGLGILQDARGFVQQSLSLYQRAYDGYKSCSGPDSLGVLQQQAHIADALIKLNRAPEAVSILERTLPAWRKIVGSGPQLSGPLCPPLSWICGTRTLCRGRAGSERSGGYSRGNNRACGSAHRHFAFDVGAGIGRTRPLSRSVAACPDCRHAARKECDFSWRKAGSIRGASGAGHCAGQTGHPIGEVPANRHKAKADDASWQEMARTGRTNPFPRGDTPCHRLHSNLLRAPPRPLHSSIQTPWD